MKPLSYPKVIGGHITDAIFNEQGHITALDGYEGRDTKIRINSPKRGFP